MADLAPREVIVQDFDICPADRFRTRMTNLDEELKTTIRRNQLLGMWAAEKLGLAGPDAENYARSIAMGTLDFDESDVLKKLRKDFAAAGVVQSDEEILRVMSDLMVRASGQMPPKRGASDAAAVMLARKLSTP
jgi:hypothetical protein